MVNLYCVPGAAFHVASDRVGHVVADGDFEFSGFGNVLCPFGGDHIPVGTVSSRIFIVERIYFPSGGGGVFPGRKGEATLFLSWDIDIKAYATSAGRVVQVFQVEEINGSAFFAVFTVMPVVHQFAFGHRMGDVPGHGRIGIVRNLGSLWVVRVVRLRLFHTVVFVAA